MAVEGNRRNSGQNRFARLKAANLCLYCHRECAGIGLALHECPLVDGHPHYGLSKSGASLRVNETADVIGMGVGNQYIGDVIRRQADGLEALLYNSVTFRAPA